MTEQEKETYKHILEIQTPSTRKCLERPIEKDEEWLNRMVPPTAQCVKEDGSVDLGVRQFSASELKIENSIRDSRGQWITNSRPTESIETGLTISAKSNAIYAFMKVAIIQKIKDKFKELMGGVKKELSYAEKIAAGMRKLSEE